MTREVDAIYEDGVLKPVEPLHLAEKQRVKLTVSDAPAPVEHPNARKAEMDWIGQNAHRYKGEWVAVQGSQLISHGPKLREVSAEARRKGVERPLFHRVSEYLGEPSAGWL